MSSLSRTWNCRGCGRENHTDVRPDGTVKCEHCGDVKSIQPSRSPRGEEPSTLDLPNDSSERRDAFLRLRDAYVLAQKLVPEEGTYEELQWILGERRSGPSHPSSLGARTIELVALWLQDLVREMEVRSPAPGDAVRDLRDATARFLAAFRTAQPIPSETSG